MAKINKKFIKAGSKVSFDVRKANGDIDSDSIVFIEDTDEIYAQEKFYQCVPDTNKGAEGSVLMNGADGPYWGTPESGGGGDTDRTYGVSWNYSSRDPKLKRIGNPNLHASLPIQSKMAGCVVKLYKDKPAELQYWLDPNDWAFRLGGPVYKVKNISMSSSGDFSCYVDKSFLQEYISQGHITSVATYYVRGRHIKLRLNNNKDFKIQLESYDFDDSLDLNNIKLEGTVMGEAVSMDSAGGEIELGSSLTGFDGQVMVYVPGFYIKSHDGRKDGADCWVKISDTQIDPTWFYQRPVYVSAYRATVFNSSNNYTPVNYNIGYPTEVGNNSPMSVNTTDVLFRGGRIEYLSDTTNDGDPTRSSLNKPYLGNIGWDRLEKIGAHDITYNQYKNILYWLWVIEYATFNFGDKYISGLTDLGYHQGGTGNTYRLIRYTDASSTQLEIREAHNHNIPTCPNGYLDDLGNRTGVKALTIPAWSQSIISPFDFTDGKTSILSSCKVTFSKEGASTSVATITSIPSSGDIMRRPALYSNGSYRVTVDNIPDGGILTFIQGDSIKATFASTSDRQSTLILTDYQYVKIVYNKVAVETNIIIKVTPISTNLRVGYPTIVLYPYKWRGIENPIGETLTKVCGIRYDNSHPELWGQYMMGAFATDDPEDIYSAVESSTTYKYIGITNQGDDPIEYFNLGDTAEILPGAATEGSLLCASVRISSNGYSLSDYVPIFGDSDCGPECSIASSVWDGSGSSNPSNEFMATRIVYDIE